jgi:NDP-sugar pyrophosphorylase family protein
VLNIVVPMAGLGSRFASAGYVDPKPMIRIHGIPMIRWVIANLTPKTPHRFIFIAQEKHVEAYDLSRLLAEWSPGCKIVSINGITDGAARTVLSAQDFIDTDDSLVIANSDQWVNGDLEGFYKTLSNPVNDGVIMTMKADDPKWSFIAKDVSGRVTKVVEKEVISNDATVGIYGFARGSDFVSSAKRMIQKGETVNGEFYVAPAYNFLIADGAQIASFEVGSESKGMFGLGIPADLQAFEVTQLSKDLRDDLWR